MNDYSAYVEVLETVSKKPYKLVEMKGFTCRESAKMIEQALYVCATSLLDEEKYTITHGVKYQDNNLK